MWPEYTRITADELGHLDLLAFEPDENALFVLIDVADDKNAALDDVLAECLETGRIKNAVIAKNEKERLALWSIREESFVAERDKAN